MEAVIVFVPTANRSPLPTHAPRVGCDPHDEEPMWVYLLFQFTHPVWGATRGQSILPVSGSVFQFTHPVWGATVCREYVVAVDLVSIHAPRVGCDEVWSSGWLSLMGFNSRTPCGVRRRSGVRQCECVRFQFTHPVWGATCEELNISNSNKGFNSRTPCGVRPPRYETLTRTG